MKRTCLDAEGALVPAKKQVSILQVLAFLY